MFKKVGVYYRFFSQKFPNQVRTRKMIGGFLLSLGLFTGFFAPAASVYANAHALDHLSTAQFQPLETTTSTGFQFPLKDYSISQCFSWIHPGIDLDAELNAPVYPVAEGKVKQIYRWSFGYGHHIIVDHGNTLESLYAHLSTAEVKLGDKVEKDTVLGRVGSTGWATGSHLHLEIHERGLPLNPLEILSQKED